MSFVKIDDKKCTLRFNNAFYPKSIIEQGVKDFGETEKIVLTESGDVMITPNKNTDVQEVGYEFYDYLLSLIQGGNKF